MISTPFLDIPKEQIEITIYGASDDLIEIETKDKSIYDEWVYRSNNSVSVLVLGAAGEAIEVTPVLTAAAWNAMVRWVHEGNDGGSVRWIKRPDGSGDPEDRGVVVTVTAPAKVKRVVNG